MENLKMWHLLAIPAIVIVVAARVNRCIESVPAWSLYQNETNQQWLMREKQNTADFTVLQAEKAYERMSDKERMEGVVYEN